MEAARAGTTKRSLAERRLAWSGVCNSVEYDGARSTARADLGAIRDRRRRSIFARPPSPSTRGTHA